MFGKKKKRALHEALSRAGVDADFIKEYGGEPEGDREYVFASKGEIIYLSSVLLSIRRMAAERPSLKGREDEILVDYIHLMKEQDWVYDPISNTLEKGKKFKGKKK